MMHERAKVFAVRCDASQPQLTKTKGQALDTKTDSKRVDSVRTVPPKVDGSTDEIFHSARHMNG